MAYTVQEVARLAGVTVKTLYHYQKIGLLVPESIGPNGYRYYGEHELARLQQILFYRELTMPLAAIKRAMEDDTCRLACLQSQQAALQARQKQLASILHTLTETIGHEKRGEAMDTEKMFTGLNREEWEEALSEQNEYLQTEYGYDMLAEGEIQPAAMDQHARHATQFMELMAEALRAGTAPNAPEVQAAVKGHIQYMNEAIAPTNADAFAQECAFLLADDFHRGMYEGLQTGLSTYIFAAARLFADAATV